MMAVRNIVRIVIAALFLSSVSAVAQMQKVSLAYDQVRAGKLDSAKLNIDQAFADGSVKSDYMSWLVRGVVYSEIYKARESSNAESPSRDIAVESFRKSLEVDTKNENAQKDIVIKKLLFLGSKYYNDINKTLDTLNLAVSLRNFEKYKLIAKQFDPGFDEKKVTRDLYDVIGSMYADNFYRTSSKNCYDNGKAYLLKARDLDTNNFTVNKNLGLMYYNQAVNIVKKLEYDVPLDELDLYQEQAKRTGLQALPYLLKAHAINKKDAVILESLSGVYYLLNEMDKYNEFKKKTEELLNQQK